jgi:hypothetical protein
MAILVGILFLHDHHRRSRVRGSVARIDRRKIHDRRCLPACSRFALDRQHDPRGRAAYRYSNASMEISSPPAACCLPWDAAAWSTRAPAAFIPHIRRRRPRFSALVWPPSACMLLGDAILVPITEVGSVACAIGWAATCAAYLRMGRSGTLPGRSKLSAVEWLVAGLGLLVAIAMMLMKVVPAIPGHFTVCTNGWRSEFGLPWARSQDVAQRLGKCHQ